MLSKYENEDAGMLREIVTCDKTWIYFFEPKRKEENKVWVENGGK